MKLNRTEYERLSGEDKRQYLDGLTPQEVSELFSQSSRASDPKSTPAIPDLSLLSEKLAVLEQQVALILEKLSISSDNVNAKASANDLPQPGPHSVFKIIEVNSRAMEANSVWSKYAWKLRVQNLTSAQVAFTASIQFRDTDSFVVNEVREPNLMLGPREEKIFTGYSLIDASVAHKVASVCATIAQ
jgi:hypothetical protein